MKFTLAGNSSKWLPTILVILSGIFMFASISFTESNTFLLAQFNSDQLVGHRFVTQVTDCSKSGFRTIESVQVESDSDAFRVKEVAFHDGFGSSSTLYLSKHDHKVWKELSQPTCVANLE